MGITLQTLLHATCGGCLTTVRMTFTGAKGAEDALEVAHNPIRVEGGWEFAISAGQRRGNSYVTKEVWCRDCAEAFLESGLAAVAARTVAAHSSEPEKRTRNTRK